jgi:tetrahydromethanopterin S-methyltransferase subunit G
MKTEGCSFGKVTREKVNNVEECVKEIKVSVENVANHYSQRLPAWATVTISVLTALLGIAVGLILS